MKKFLVTTLMLSLVSTTSVLANTIPVYFEDAPLELSQNPVVKNGTTLVPFRGIFEALGYNVSFDSNSNTIKGYNDENEITLKIGSKTANVNGSNKSLSIAPQIVNSTTMVPLRFVSEAAGYSVGWHDETDYITIGENDEELIDVYEKASVIELGGEGKLDYIRCEDLYTVNGTGKYSSYKELMGHPFTGYDIYYKGTANSFEVATVEPTYNPNEIVTWTFEGQTYQNKQSDVFDFFSGYSTLAGGIDAEDGEYLTKVFGDTYCEWFMKRFVSSNASYIVGEYLSYLDGSTFDYYYEGYAETKAFEEAIEQHEVEKATEEAAEQKQKDDLFDYFEKEDAALDQYYSQWISANTLRNQYNIYATWMGDYIIFQEGNSQDPFLRIDGSPKSKFEEGKIYEGNGIHYQYIRTTTVPFPEAKDGSGVIEIDVNSIVYSIPDLKAKGII